MLGLGRRASFVGRVCMRVGVPCSMCGCIWVCICLRFAEGCCIAQALEASSAALLWVSSAVLPQRRGAVLLTAKHFVLLFFCDVEGLGRAAYAAECRGRLHVLASGTCLRAVSWTASLLAGPGSTHKHALGEVCLLVGVGCGVARAVAQPEVATCVWL